MAVVQRQLNQQMHDLFLFFLQDQLCALLWGLEMAAALVLLSLRWLQDERASLYYTTKPVRDP